MGIKKKIYPFYRALARHSLTAHALAGARSLVEHPNYEQSFRGWLTEEQRRDKQYMRRVRRDIAYCAVRHETNAEEYFRYKFEFLNDKGRHEYVGVKEMLRRFNQLDSPERMNLTDKSLAYEMFKEYYRREQIEILSDEDLPVFLDYLTRHRTAIVKPLDSCGGNGVCRIDVAEGEEESAFRAIRAKGGCVIEEMIRQAPEMAKFHPGSVNTIRVVTCNRGGEISIVQTSVRMGMGDSFVDNGCLSSAVDTETGIITSMGRKAHGNGLYVIHPDTGEQILGARIPKWDELLAFARKLPEKLPNQRIIGWDLALAEDGWMMIEGNSHPHIQILAGNGVGVRDLYEDMVR